MDKWAKCGGFEGFPLRPVDNYIGELPCTRLTNTVINTGVDTERLVFSVLESYPQFC